MVQRVERIFTVFKGACRPKVFAQTYHATTRVVFLGSREEVRSFTIGMEG